MKERFGDVGTARKVTYAGVGLWYLVRPRRHHAGPPLPAGRLRDGGARHRQENPPECPRGCTSWHASRKSP